MEKIARKAIRLYGTVRLENGSTYPYFYQWLGKMIVNWSDG